MSFSVSKRVERKVECRTIQIGLRILDQIRRQFASQQSGKDTLKNIFRILFITRDAVRRAVNERIVLLKDVFQFLRRRIAYLERHYRHWLLRVLDTGRLGRLAVLPKMS